MDDSNTSAGAHVEPAPPAATAAPLAGADADARSDGDDAAAAAAAKRRRRGSRGGQNRKRPDGTIESTEDGGMTRHSPTNFPNRSAKAASTTPRRRTSRWCASPRSATLELRSCRRSRPPDLPSSASRHPVPETERLPPSRRSGNRKRRRGGGRAAHRRSGRLGHIGRKRVGVGQRVKPGRGPTQAAPWRSRQVGHRRRRRRSVRAASGP